MTTLSGRVTVADGTVRVPVRRARVTAVRESDGTIATTDTDVNGDYRFDPLTIASYRVQAEKAGFVADRPPSRGFERPSLTELIQGTPGRLDLVMQRGAALEGRLVNEAR